MAVNKTNSPYSAAITGCTFMFYEFNRCLPLLMDNDAEIQGQEGPRFPSRRQAQIGAQRRKGALLPFQSVFGTLPEVLCQFPQLCAG